MKIFLMVLAAFGLFAYVSCESCVQCHSKTDERCATDPMSIMNKDCPTNNTLCYTRVLNGYTIRGCTSELDNATLQACNNELECITCTYKEGCNRQVFPQYRPKCLQCSGNSTDSPCGQEVFAYSKVCPIYRYQDKCFIRNTNRLKDGSFKRGCLSSAQANKQCIVEGNCYTCEGHGCNSLLANNTLIPEARDGAVNVIISVTLLLATGLTSLVL